MWVATAASQRQKRREQFSPIWKGGREEEMKNQVQGTSLITVQCIWAFMAQDNVTVMHTLHLTSLGISMCLFL